MKALKITMTAAILGFALGGVSFAEEVQDRTTDAGKSEAMMKAEMIKKDHIMMMDGKMMDMKGG